MFYFSKFHTKLHLSSNISCNFIYNVEGIFKLWKFFCSRPFAGNTQSVHNVSFPAGHACSLCSSGHACSLCSSGHPMIRCRSTPYNDFDTSVLSLSNLWAGAVPWHFTIPNYIPWPRPCLPLLPTFPKHFAPLL